MGISWDEAPALDLSGGVNVWVALLCAVLAGMLAGLILSGSYKHFVTDRIMDWSGMENPDAYRAEETLTRFSWKQ